MPNVTLALNEYEKLKKYKDDYRSLEKSQREVEEAAVKTATERLENKYKKVLDQQKKYTAKYDKITEEVKEDIESDFFEQVNELEKESQQLNRQVEILTLINNEAFDILDNYLILPWYKRMFVNFGRYFERSMDEFLQETGLGDVELLVGGDAEDDTVNVEFK